MATRKRYMKKETIYDETGEGKVAVGIRLTFPPKGPTVGTIDAKLADYPKSMIDEAAAHGFRQKIGDAAAHEDVNSVETAFAACKAMHERLLTGTWNEGGAGGFGVSDAWILKAVADLKSKSDDEVQAVWDGLSDEAKTKIRSDTRIKAHAEKLRAEDKAAKAPEPETDPLAAF